MIPCTYVPVYVAGSVLYQGLYGRLTIW